MRWFRIRSRSAVPASHPADGAAREGGGLLARLRRDKRGNVLALCAAGIIPLIGMVGGAVDMSRLYITRTRLQHACDAGALAGRKQMGGGAWNTSSSNAALQFFDGNFAPTAYGITARTRGFTENAGRVAGLVTATVPMTLMQVFNQPTQVVTVKCSAEMKLPNTDVMFVLDTTGSMNCAADDTTCTNNGNTPAPNSKIAGLKTAVKCFYEIVAQQDTDATCTSTPSGGISSQIQVRFGFVPYSSNVNVGRLLPSAYFSTSADYQTRTILNATPGWSDWFSNAQFIVYGACPSIASYDDGRGTVLNLRNGTTVATGGGRSLCRFDWQQKGPQWRYDKRSINVSALETTGGWPRTMTLPIGEGGTNKTITWEGCIEERQTVQASNYDPVPDGAKDLDIDLVPSGASTQWKPFLPDVEYLRGVPNITSDYSLVSSATTLDTNNSYAAAPDTCSNEAEKLQVWSGAAAFDNYVNGLQATGNTYHDIGMIWGARLMSPDGIFKSENKTTPGGGQITRHMIFMTDGDSTSNPCDYNAYGVPWFDQRQTTDVGTAANCGSNRQALIDQINRRLETMCKVIQGKGITLWVVSYGGTGIAAATKSRLQNCASPPDSAAPTHYFDASNPTILQQDFATIANAIAQLRLTT